MTDPLLAHNIESVCRDAGSFEATYPELLKVKVELIETLRSRHLFHPNETMLNVNISCLYCYT
jgi:hypothetical protein